MKIAVFHNFMDNIGGAEMVGLTLARELKADFYSTNIDEDKIGKMGFNDINLISIGKIPLNAPYRQQAALSRFRKLDLKNNYDFYIIGGDWAVSGAVNNKPNLWYVHSPIREIWDLYEFTRQNIVPCHLRWCFDLWMRLNRYLNKKYVHHVDRLVCNSKNTRHRVKKFLQKDAGVIHPPTETSNFSYEKPGNYWLSVNRLIGHKRIALQIDAFKKLPDEKLVIVGSYEQSKRFKEHAAYIKKIKPPNVEILSWVDHSQLLDLYAGCKGFIATARDEDFGLAPVEAMASGKPVIAPNEGGYRETVIDGKTGMLIDDISVEKLIAAIVEVGGASETFKDACLDQAKNFDTRIFIDRIKSEIENSQLSHKY